MTTENHNTGMTTDAIVIMGIFSVA